MTSKSRFEVREDKGGAHPDNRRRNNGPKWMPGANQGTIPNIRFSLLHFHHYVQGFPSTNGPYGDQFQAPVHTPSPFQSQQMGFGGPPGSHMSVIDPNIQQMDQHMRLDFEKWLKSTIFQTQSMAAGISGGNYDPQAAYSSLSRNVEGTDSMSTGMANLSLNDYQPRIPTHHSPPTSFSSDHQKPIDQMGTSIPFSSNLSPHNNAVQQGSHFNPSLAPRMNEPDMANRLSLPTETRPYGNNPNGPPPPASTSPFNFQPSFSVGPNYNLNIQDRSSVHHVNKDSFNEHNTTVRDSFNDNSLVDTTGKHSGMFSSMICLS